MNETTKTFYFTLLLPDQKLYHLSLRIVTLVVLIVLLTTHMRTLRVFRWEKSVSGGVLVTYSIAAAGLVLCAGGGKCGVAFQAYLTITGFILLLINAAVLWSRWKHAEEMRMVADFLMALGVPVNRYISTKVVLSVVAAVLLFLDGILVTMFNPVPNTLQTSFKF